jgi:hypothetical protein
MNFRSASSGVHIGFGARSGPSLLQNVYENALVHDLRQAGFAKAQQ